MPEVTLITTSQVADKFGVDSSAVRKWVAEGRLIPAVRTPGGHYRFDEASLAAFMTAPTEVSA
jgi:excisionase family DNA binding protein